MRGRTGGKGKKKRCSPFRLHGLSNRERWSAKGRIALSCFSWVLWLSRWHSYGKWKYARQFTRILSRRSFFNRFIRKFAALWGSNTPVSHPLIIRHQKTPHVVPKEIPPNECDSENYQQPMVFKPVGQNETKSPRSEIYISKPTSHREKKKKDKDKSPRSRRKSTTISCLQPGGDLL